MWVRGDEVQGESFMGCRVVDGRVLAQVTSKKRSAPRVLLIRGLAAAGCGME